jgi:hypothetical protein
MGEQTRAVLYGGPLDGHDVAPRALLYVWVGVTTGGVRVYERPGRDRLLYRRRDGTRGYEFAGYTHALCEGCQQPHLRNDERRCSGCGGNLIPA